MVLAGMLPCGQQLANPPCPLVAFEYWADAQLDFESGRVLARQAWAGIGAELDAYPVVGLVQVEFFSVFNLF